MKKNSLFVIISLALIALISVPSVLAYFYTYAESSGSVALTLKDDTDINEPYIRDGVKHVEILAEEGDPVMVRVRVFNPNNVDWEYANYDASLWKQEGDYMVYQQPLNGGETATIDVKVHLESMEEPKDGDEFNVIVVYEAVPALYDDATGTWYGEWND